jgi:hypothetical protein
MLRPHIFGAIVSGLIAGATLPAAAIAEQCAVAVRDQGTKAESVLPDIRMLGNAWISPIVYQAGGYADIAP